MIYEDIFKKPLKDLKKDHPYIIDFFESVSLEELNNLETLDEYFLRKKEIFNREKVKELKIQIKDFIDQMESLRLTGVPEIKKIGIQAGFNKEGERELFDIEIKRGEIISVVGPTGSGKTRLLEDIECLSQGDSPSKRIITINGVDLEKSGVSPFDKVVAEVSQNMNFVMDLSVGEFIAIHAESRLINNIENAVEKVFLNAVGLAGEPFLKTTPVTSLSGGQSRALMISDVAYLSDSPIVLIDEIENAGVDRIKALELLAKSEKIVIMATHDPLLALYADKRIVIKNGGIFSILQRDEKEIKNLDILEFYQTKFSLLREKIRTGERLNFNMEDYFQGIKK